MSPARLITTEVASRDGTKIAFDVSGDGPPLILIAGHYPTALRLPAWSSCSRPSSRSSTTTVAGAARASTRRPTLSNARSRISTRSSTRPADRCCFTAARRARTSPSRLRSAASRSRGSRSGTQLRRRPEPATQGDDEVLVYATTGPSRLSTACGRRRTRPRLRTIPANRQPSLVVGWSGLMPGCDARF